VAEPIVVRPAQRGDLPWLTDLVTLDVVAPFLSTTAADDLAAAVESGEVLLAWSATGERLGAVRVATVNRRSRITAVQTLVVHPDARGRGVGATVLRIVARDAFARGVHRLESEVYGFNPAALRCFEAAGFRREGVRRRAYDRHGAWQDGVLFGLLADD
jgi:RimJ/RimL family protein N-acetyltransferase